LLLVDQYLGLVLKVAAVGVSQGAKTKRRMMHQPNKDKRKNVQTKGSVKGRANVKEKANVITMQQSISIPKHVVTNIIISMTTTIIINTAQAAAIITTSNKNKFKSQRNALLLTSRPTSWAKLSLSQATPAAACRY
jgi:hypothetical protein